MIDNRQPQFDDRAGCSPGAQRWPLLVIGYGNDLRGDDAVGQRVAAAVAQWWLPGVRTITAHQLTPELADSLAASAHAIFVDAQAAEGVPGPIQIQRLEPEAIQPASAHSADPRTLLAFAQTIYGRCPQAWWITIPVARFDFGADLSPEAWYGAATALRWIRRCIATLPELAAKQNLASTQPA
jgi:hydrogenase maturation protease